MLKTEKALGAGLWLITVAIAVWGHFHIPDGLMATHFGLNGAADGYQPRDMGLSVLPIMTLVMNVVLLWILPALLRQSLGRSAGAYGAIILAVLAVMTILQGSLVFKAMGQSIDVSQVAVLGLGFMLIIIGNFLPKLRQNHVAGIRLPWTLNNERVWDRTHRFAGGLTMLGGLTAVTAAFLPQPEWRGGIAMAGAILPMLIAIVYSAAIARKP